MPPTTNAIMVMLTSLFAGLLGYLLGRWIDSGTIAALAGLLGGAVALILAHVWQALVNSKWWADTTPPNSNPKGKP